MRVHITSGVILHTGKAAQAGEEHEVPDNFARVLINHHQARVAPAPKPETEAKKPEPEKPKKADE